MWHVNKTTKSLLFIPLFFLISVAITHLPEAAAQANANLFVSVEGTFVSDRFGGPMVIEVVVSDSDISDIDEAETEPDVTVNGNQLRMTQTTDGNWYAYFADLTMATSADAISTTKGTSLDFGMGCDAASGVTAVSTGAFVGSFSDTEGVYVASVMSGSTEVPGVLSAGCTSPKPIGNPANNVVREPLTPTPVAGSMSPDSNGQIGVHASAWPFIQLYNFVPGADAEIKYNIGGGSPQIVSIEYSDSLEDVTDLQFDRTQYPPGAYVHFTISDNWLNVDPTDEDSWTFATNNANFATVYQAFDEHGIGAGSEIVGGTPNIQPSLANLNAGDLGVLLIDYNPNSAPVDSILDLIDNDDQILVKAINTANSFASNEGGIPLANLGQNTMPVTIVETAPSSGIFVNTDESDRANIKIANDAPRGASATIDYNDSARSILVANFFGNIDINPVDSEWNSGEKIPVVLNDVDANMNSRTDEDLDIFDPNVSLIPSVVTGTPFTLQSLSSAQFVTDVTTNLIIEEVQPFSQRAMLSSPGIGPSDTYRLELTLSDTYNDLYNSINNPSGAFRGFNFFNYDVRSIANSMVGGSTNSVDISMFDPSSGRTATIATNEELQRFINLGDATGDPIFGMTGNQQVVLIFNFDVTGAPTIDSVMTIPVVADFFSYGFYNEGIQPNERIANQIIRLELEETGDNTAQFEGSLEFTMLNQLNVLDSDTYLDSVDPIADDSKMIVHEDLTDEDAPRVNYYDLGSDGTSTQISDKQDVPTHSGVVSFNLQSYDVGGLVTITLDDQDLNSDSELIDIFTVADFVGDSAFDTVGASSLPVFSFGPLGTLLEITFDDSRWASGLAINGGACNASGIPDDGLGTTGIALIETNMASGVFIGDYFVPETYCNSFTGQITDVDGTEMKVNYVDFRDSVGQIDNSFDIVTIGQPVQQGSLSFTNIRVETSSGNPVTVPDLDQQFSIRTDIRNNFATTQNFWYYAKVLETGDEVRVPMSLQPGEISSPNSMGICKSPGTCTIDAFVFDNMINQDQLTPPLRIIFNIQDVIVPPPIQVPVPESVPVPDPVPDPVPTCGSGTVLRNGICVVENKPKNQVSFGETEAAIVVGGGVAVAGGLGIAAKAGVFGKGGVKIGKPGPKPDPNPKPDPKPKPAINVEMRIEVGFE